MRTRVFVHALALGLAVGTASAAPQDQDVFTGFEQFNPNTQVGVPFDIGSSPSSATFSGDGFAGRAGIGQLYFAGVRAWMINPSGTGTIDFETNAATVEFWARTRSPANGNTVITAFDDLNQIVDSIALDVGDPFQLVSFSGSIDRIEVVNNATGAGQMNSIDDFGFTPVPEPTTAMMMLAASLALVRRRQTNA